MREAEVQAVAARLRRPPFAGARLSTRAARSIRGAEADSRRRRRSVGKVARSGLVFVWHVEEAEARERVGFEQAFLEKLLLDLLDLRSEEHMSELQSRQYLV